MIAVSRQLSGLNKVMIIDDAPDNLNVLESLLSRAGYQVSSFPRGELALAAARQSPPDLVLLDILMPGMDGYQVCRRFKHEKSLNAIPIIFLSGLTASEDVAVGFECGGSDYVIKPFQESEILARVETHLRLYAHHVRLESLVQAKIVEIADTQMSVIFALAKLADSRDEQTGQHLERVQTYCGVLGARLLEIAPASAGITEATIQTVCLASVLHDIGKVGVPDEILLNRGKLTPQEFDRMKSHTLIGATTLESVLDRHPRNRFIETGIEIARSHHERWDGGGYPDGLKGGDIPLSARIVAVADVYDALRSRRTYKDSCSHERSVDLIVAGAGNHFDPLLVEAFKQCEQSLNAAFEAPLQPRPPSWRN